MIFQSKSWILMIFLMISCSNQGGSQAPKPTRLELAIWSEYLAQETLDAYEKKTGIHVAVSNYASNEELLAKLQAGGSGYDLAMPSDYMVKILAGGNLLLPLDRTKIANFGKIEKKLLGKSFDPENRFSVPYAWGTTGIAIRRDLYKGKLDGWKDLFADATLKGRLSLLDDGREGIGAALKALGRPLNSKSEKELKEAKALLMSARSRISAFTSEPISGIVSGEVFVAQMYSVDAYQARIKMGNGKEKDLDYILPVEGGTFWIDHFVIPKGGKNVDGAHAFIDFLTTPENVAALMQKRFSGAILPEAFARLPSQFTVYPSMKLSMMPTDRFELIEDLGEFVSVWDRVWTEVKAGGT